MQGPVNVAVGDTLFVGDGNAMGDWVGDDTLPSSVVGIFVRDGIAMGDWVGEDD